MGVAPWGCVQAKSPFPEQREGALGLTENRTAQLDSPAAGQSEIILARGINRRCRLVFRRRCQACQATRSRTGEDGRDLIVIRSGRLNLFNRDGFDWFNALITD